MSQTRTAITLLLVAVLLSSCATVCPTGPNSGVAEMAEMAGTGAAAATGGAISRAWNPLGIPAGLAGDLGLAGIALGGAILVGTGIYVAGCWMYETIEAGAFAKAAGDTPGG